MGVEMTGASSCSSHRILGDTSPRAEGQRDNGAGSGLIRDLPAARSGGGWGQVRTRWGAPGGFLLDRGGRPEQGLRLLRSPGVLTNLPNSEIAPPGPRPGQAIWINFHCSSPPMPGAETKKLGLCSPQNKGSPPRPRPGSPPAPPDSPLPQLRGFEGKQSGGAGSVAEPGLRTPPVGPVTQRGKGGGGGAGDAFTTTPVPQHTPSPPSAPYPRPGPDPAARSKALPPQLLPGAASEVGVCRGVRAPGGAPPTLAHPERRAGDGAPAAAGLALQPGTERRGSGAWLSRTARLPSGAGARPGGRGREIRSHNIGLRPSPPQTFRRGWGSQGQFGGLEKIPAADRTARGTPAP